jgi:hypothetical protein
MMATESEVWESMNLIDLVAKRINIDSSLVAGVGLDVLRSAALTHRPERGPFRPYALVCLKSALLKYKRKQGLCCELVDIADSRQTDPEETLPFGVSVEQLRDSVTEEEYELLYSWFVENTSRAALEARYGVLRTTLWVRVQKILKRVRQA